MYIYGDACVGAGILASGGEAEAPPWRPKLAAHTDAYSIYTLYIRTVEGGGGGAAEKISLLTRRYCSDTCKSAFISGAE